MERFVVIVNGLQPLTIITKLSILDVAAALDLPLTPIIFHTISKIEGRLKLYLEYFSEHL